jgi:DNA-binding CsgD family transcriptional regulator
MRRIRIQEAKSDRSGGHVSPGKAYTGWEAKPPTVGQSYTIAVDPDRIFKTSLVEKQLDGYLVTKNSLYEFEVLEEKPYDLRGGDLAKTQEMVFPIDIGQGNGNDGLKSLSKREREVFQLLAEGFSIRETADFLFISSKTVEAHKYHIMKKLGIRTMNQWIKEAIRRGIIQV